MAKKLLQAQQANDDPRIDLGFIATSDVPMWIFDDYSWRCGVAYNEMFRSLLQLFDGLEIDLDYELKPPHSVKLLPLMDISTRVRKKAYAQAQKGFYRIVGRCGAMIGAAKKHGQRDILITLFKQAVERQSLDVTPAVANAAAKEVFGRGVDKATLNATFGTPGRTASDKSRVYADPEQQAAYMAQLTQLQLLHESFNHYSVEIREKNIREWSVVWRTRHWRVKGR